MSRTPELFPLTSKEAEMVSNQRVGEFFKQLEGLDFIYQSVSEMENGQGRGVRLELITRELLYTAEAKSADELVEIVSRQVDLPQVEPEAM
jgi:hypothetical protein